MVAPLNDVEEVLVFAVIALVGGGQSGSKLLAQELRIIHYGMTV